MLGRILEQRVEALLIGGAVMLGLKDATKDIDLVCWNEEDRKRLLAACRALGFQIVGPEKKHERLGVNRLAVKGGGNLDIFAEQISPRTQIDLHQERQNYEKYGMTMKRLADIQEILRQKKPILRERFGVLEIGIFGSFARGEEKDASDLDILVELERPVGLIKFVGLQNYLSDELGEKVDLVTKSALKPRIKKNILSEVVYV
ncbi:MAG: nucleotidyltransferase family protein [Methanothrix sp.]